MSVMTEMLKYIMCANFMEIGWVVIPQLCLLCKEAVAWSYNKREYGIKTMCIHVITSTLLIHKNLGCFLIPFIKHWDDSVIPAKCEAHFEQKTLNKAFKDVFITDWS